MNALTAAVAAVIEDPAGRVLLCQQSQGHHLWGLPGGRVRNGENPLRAAVRDIREEIGTDIEIIDLVGLYHLTGVETDDGLPDVLVHVFRARLDGEATVNAPGRISRLSWRDKGDLPEPIMATTRRAIADATHGRSGVLAQVHRDCEPDIPDAEASDTVAYAAA